ncbi:MAG: PLDc N-terminal domain-containing protein [Paenibacillus sp.]|nr:PLDc N-terminal domain-containing protein [Paenibacillus sp.]
MSSRSLAFKLGWALTVFMFPFGGLLLYLPVTFLLP